MKAERQVRIPQPLDLRDALRLYWEKNELDNEDIKRLFGSLGNQRIVLLKRMVKDVQTERGIKSFDHKAINTRLAYEVWGFPYAELFKRFKNCEALSRKDVFPEEKKEDMENEDNKERNTELH